MKRVAHWLYYAPSNRWHLVEPLENTPGCYAAFSACGNARVRGEAQWRSFQPGPIVRCAVCARWWRERRYRRADLITVKEDSRA
jgi:hypothetical protein